MLLAFILIWCILTIFIIYSLKPVKYEIIIQYVPDIINEPIPDTQNTHDTLVRQALWEKFSILYAKNHAQEVIKNSFNHAEYYIKNTNNPDLINLIKTISLGETVTTCKNLGLPEYIEENIVFSIIWNEFIIRKLDLNILIQQMLDCYEDNILVCINGRVSRYISAFEGITDDELGKSEVTENILFQEALRETQKLYNESKKNISQNISQKYPQLNNRISELMEAF